MWVKIQVDRINKCKSIVLNHNKVKKRQKMKMSKIIRNMRKAKISKYMRSDDVIKCKGDVHGANIVS